MSEIMNFLKKERLLSPTVIASILVVLCLGYVVNMGIVQDRRRRIASGVAWDTVESFLDEISEENIVGVYIDSPSLIIPIDELDEFLSLKGDIGADVIYLTADRFSQFGDGRNTASEDGGKGDIWGFMGYDWFVDLYIFNEDMTIAYRYKLTVFVTVLEMYDDGYHTESWTK